MLIQNDNCFTFSSQIISKHNADVPEVKVVVWTFVFVVFFSSPQVFLKPKRYPLFTSASGSRSTGKHFIAILQQYVAGTFAVL